MQLSFFIVLYLCFATAQNNESDVLATEARIVNAVLASDTTALGELLLSDYSYTLPDGKIIDKAQFMHDVATWWEPVSVVHRAQKVRLHGNTALVVGIARYQWKNKAGVLEAAEEQYTDTYVAINGKWRRAASHASCLSGRCT